MYGYLKFSPGIVGKQTHKLLKRYYCATCLALKQNYGFFAPLVLSYDLVVLPVLLDIQDSSTTNCHKCFYRMKNSCHPNQNESWKKIAAVNLAIAEQKINDSLNDEKSFSKKIKYRIAKFIMRSPFKKARKENENIFNCADIGLKATMEVEKNGGRLEEQGRTFADMIKSMLDCITTLTEEQINFIYGISTWLCLIDAIDDYEKDSKSGQYNPLLCTHIYNSNSSSVFSWNYLYILRVYKESLDLTKKAPVNNLLRQYSDLIIPLQTRRILKKLTKGS